jgi:hypothetical protein
MLTDWPILQALTRAVDRGVKVRIYLAGGQFKYGNLDETLEP